MRKLSKKRGALDGKVGASKFSIENDDFDLRLFKDIKDHSSALLQTEEKGKKEYEQFPELQQDLFDSLFKYSPRLREEWEIKRDFLLNKEIMNHMVESDKYKQLRAMTTLDQVSSAVGSEIMSEQALELVKKLKEQRQALQEALDAAKEMADAEAEAGQDGEEKEDNGDPNGKGKSKEQLTLEEARKKYEEAMKNFKDAVKKPEMKQGVERMMMKVKDEVRAATEMISNWGLERSDQFQRKPCHEKMELLNRLRNNSKLQKIAQLAGRYRRMAIQQRREKVKKGLEDFYSVKQGSDLSHLIPTELLRLINPDTELQFFLDFIDGKTLQYEVRGKEKKAKGPIIVCLDSSGSMDGTPEIWAKSVALALLEVAKEQKRDFCCIHFSSGYRRQNLHVNDFPKGQPFDIEQLIDMAEYFEAGGTEFEPPLDLAREKIGSEKRWLKSDIIFVTDGNSVIGDKWEKEYLSWKKANKVSIFTVLIDAYANTDVCIKKISDRIDRLSNIRDDADNLALTLFLEV